MRKKIIVSLVLCAFMGLNLAPVVSAQSIPGPGGTVSATVQPILEFAIKTVKKMTSGVDVDPWLDGQDVSSSPSFDFGTLQKQLDSSGNTLYMKGQFFYYVLLLASTSGRKYRITETGTQLTGPSNVKLDINSVFMVPDYQWQDLFKFGSSSVQQGAMPSGTTLGPPNSACLSNTLVYEDAGAGLGRIVRAIIAISGPPAPVPPAITSFVSNCSGGHNGSSCIGSVNNFISWKPVTPDQTSGSYQGSITFTLTLI